MICATLRKMEDANGKASLFGRLNQPLERGSLVMLKRNGDNYDLVAVSDKRAVNTDEQTLFSFIEPTADDVARMKAQKATNEPTASRTH